MTTERPRSSRPFCFATVYRPPICERNMSNITRPHLSVLPPMPIHIEKRDWLGRKKIIHIGDDDPRSLQQPQGGQDRNPASDDHWYKKPVGIVLLSVLAGLIIAAII